MMLKPSEILYTQDSIGNKFRNGKRISETVDDICEGRYTIDRIPIISVAQVSGKWRSVDNRRLWVFKQLELRGKCSQIPVVVVSSIPDRKGSSTNGGLSVRVRGGGHGARLYDYESDDCFRDDIFGCDDDLFDFDNDSDGFDYDW